MRKSLKIAAAAAAACVALTIGSASTASNTIAAGAANPKAGYAKTAVSGATVNAIQVVTKDDGSTIWSVNLKVAGDTTLQRVLISINDNGQTGCGTGSFDSVKNETSYMCEPASIVKTADVASLGIVVVS